MKTRQYYIAGFITMISLMLVCPAANANTTMNAKSAIAQANLKIDKPESKVTVLAKGQNHLPKRVRTDC